jgi:hypothetical protein
MTADQAHTFVCRYLSEHGPQAASIVGAVLWRGRKRGRVVSTNGGGDYAAQMLLGRMRKAGLVRLAWSEGSSLWEVTTLGREMAR